MCNATCSESGQLLSIKPCGWYIKLLSEKSRLEGHCAGMEDGIIINKATIANQSELIEKLLAENEVLKQERDALLKVREAADKLADAAEGYPCTTEYDPLYVTVKDYKEARDGNQ